MRQSIAVKKWRGSRPPTCDFCHSVDSKTFIDGKTQMGPWALMCPSCFNDYGIGLGEGRGQKYNRDTLLKVAG